MLQGLASFLWTIHTLSEEKHVRSVSVGFGRFRSVLVDFGRFSPRVRSVSEVSGALGGALRRVLSVKRPPAARPWVGTRLPGYQITVALRVRETDTEM